MGTGWSGTGKGSHGPGMDWLVVLAVYLDLCYYGVCLC